MSTFDCLICSLDAEGATRVQTVVAAHLFFEKRIAKICEAHREEVERVIREFEVAVHASMFAKATGL